MVTYNELKLRFRRKSVCRGMLYLLRHKEGFTDEDGWVSINTLVNELKKKYKYVCSWMVNDIVKQDKEERFVIQVNEICAVSGHTTGIMKVQEGTKKPPKTLYHGTALRFASQIMDEGIRGMTREFVYLSEDDYSAMGVGARHGSPCVFRVDSGKMYEDGYEFYRTESGIWFTKEVPVEYIN